ncbi:tigger transposable element-derived protein 6-like [Homalodisca vitripennis]|uniref:tigger transposable element-derived protein 6-like n=1 Tax=Homalodisca vitripennis TaxID=197043 RepID=UPI001EECE09C|nr:tigger transposable element-derived protein 6-like [Homalodisca vitripennis]
MDANNKKKRRAISVECKRKIIKCVEDNPAKKKLDIVKELGISPSTLATILKKKEKFDDGSVLCSKIRKIRSCELKDVEECVVKWLKQCRDKNIAISGPILQEKAQQFAFELGHENFRASSGWLQNFKKRK